MKKRIFTVIFCGLLILNTAGCGDNDQMAEEKKTADTVSTVSVSESDNTDVIEADVHEIAADATVTTDPPESEEIKSAISDTTDGEQAETDASTGFTSAQTDPTEKNDQKPTIPSPTKPSVTQPTAPKTEPKTEPATQPKTEPKTEPATQPKTEPKTEPTEPATEPFNIGYWVSYAQSYAISIGLQLDSGAVSCWDNPIVAGSHSLYLERDICGRLDRYNNDPDITQVWIWAEPRGDGSYDLFIGYA